MKKYLKYLLVPVLALFAIFAFPALFFGTVIVGVSYGIVKIVFVVIPNLVFGQSSWWAIISSTWNRKQHSTSQQSSLVS